MSRRQRRAQTERRRRAVVSGRSVAAAGGLAVVATLLSGAVAEADTFTVMNTNDSGTGSLRAEITAANAQTVPASNTILFASGLSGSIDLASTLPTITHPLYINGPGANVLTVHGSAMAGIFYIGSGLSGYSGISGLTLTGGHGRVGGAVNTKSSLDLTGDAIHGNTSKYGGGVSGTGGSLSIYGSTISGNTAPLGGGGIAAQGSLYMYDSTVAGNTTTYAGGGVLQSGGSLTITDSTISGNQAPGATSGTGGGINIGTTSTSPRLEGTIVSGNTAAKAGPDIYTSTSAGHPTPTAPFSLIGSLSGSGITADGTDLVGVDPLLGPLQLNGGSTETMLPAFNSPVIDRGKAFGAKFDQRGLTRPVDVPGYPNAAGGDGSDIGAVELQAAEVLPVVGGLSTGSGPVGSPVVISGLRLATATSVLFGATPAPFAVNSLGQVVAVAPAGSGTVDVRVITPGGESPVLAADRFTYTVAPPPTQKTTASFGNQTITLTTPSLSACTASTSSLPVTLTSTPVTGSKATKLKFSSAGFFIGKGVKHTRKKIKHLGNGKAKKITVTTYSPNLVVRRVPATVALKLAGLKAGSHTLKVVLSYKKTVTKHHHKKTVTVTKTLSSTFKVC